ncbi:chromosomal replication initiator protein DnaA [bacterium AH-315-J21]|nr:chromosomal replication initiator protein DnaA [bacterium AH-315-J21]
MSEMRPSLFPEDAPDVLPGSIPAPTVERLAPQPTASSSEPLLKEPVPKTGSTTRQPSKPNNRISDATWRGALNYMSRRLKKQSFATWLRPTIGVVGTALDGSKLLKITVPNQFVADWLAENYSPLIEEALTETTGAKLQFSFLIRKQAAPSEQTEIGFGELANGYTDSDFPVERPAQAPRRNVSNINHGLHDRYRFDNLVVGKFNEFAHAACAAVAENPGGTKYNPLVIYGGVGLGKTHLAQAIGLTAMKNSPRVRVMYATSEKFTTDFINSLGKSTTGDFSALYRSVDILIVDDIQFFSGKESTQEQFFHTFNALYNAGKQIILTADRRPQDIKGLEARLLSRFSSGLVTDIQKPDFESRVAILSKKLEEYDFHVDENILHFIAERVSSNVRELEGALTHLYAKASVEKVSRVDEEFVTRSLSDTLTSSRLRVSVRLIQDVVAESFEVPVAMLKAKKRSANIALARQVAMYVTRDLTGRSLQQIGHDFGGRDHSTVIHACSLVASRMQEDSIFKDQVDEIFAMLR